MIFEKHIPRKRFGQNFLKDKHVIEQIIAAINPKTQQHFVEIGPGQGALTKPMLAIVKQLTAIEIDRDLVAKLAEDCEALGHLNLICGDALKFDFTELKTDAQKLRLFGNLPYNISTPLLFHLFDHSQVIEDMHFMLQSEVVDRMIATPGSKQFGRLSVMTQFYCRVEKILSIPPQAFYPAPKVNSAIVKLTPREDFKSQVHDLELLQQLVTHAFGQRRKTLRNSLKTLVRDEQWQNIKLDSQLRAEKLSVQDFVMLSNFLSIQK